MRIPSIAVLLISTLVFGGVAYSESTQVNNEELDRIKLEDQADRRPVSGVIDWSAVSKRDAERKARVLELYRLGKLSTGADYYNAALVLQHGDQPEDYLLAHELSIVAIIKGDPRARILAADSEDRFLISIGRKQRFATQYGGQPMSLFEVDDGPTAITDGVREDYDVSSLAIARQREELMRDQVLSLEERARKYANSVAEDPTNRDAYRQLFRAYVGLGQNADALETAKALVALEPTSADDHYDLACIYALNGMKQDAITSLRQAIELGYAKWEWIATDTDLATIRSEPGYAKLLARYPALAMAGNKATGSP